MATDNSPINLVLEDGSVFSGYAFGSQRSVSGEVVFTTGMVGYPESLTDPSYWGQILVMTYPLVGNYGVPGDEREYKGVGPDGREEDGLLRHFESERIQVSGLVLASYADQYSHWNAKRSLAEWMREFDVPGIAGLDTRALTKRLREQGTMLGKIVPEGDEDAIDFVDPNLRDLVAEVSTREVIHHEGGGGAGNTRVTLIDCGVKNAIIRCFLRRGISVTRVPCDYDFLDDPGDGIVLSSGPGDPKMCKQTIENVREALDRNIPVLGICLGSQIIALAAGADTYKLKYGHRSQNQPCVEVGTGDKCYITTQNHGYAVDSRTLPQDWREWFFNNNDRTNEGLMHISKPFFGTQFHPEASPGPDDTDFIFDMFVRTLK